MPDLAALTRDEQLVPAAVEAAASSSDDLVAALEQAGDATTRAALAIALGLRADTGAAPALLALADDDGLDARAAGWALGRCADEQALLAAATDSGLDLREQAYRALAGLAARGVASPELAAAMRARVTAELERAASGRTSLAEHATRVLAVLGAEETTALIQQVIECDPLADRFELERQRKQVESEGRDQETTKELADWTLVFADHLTGANEIDEPASPIIDTEAAAAPSQQQAPPRRQHEPAAAAAPVPSTSSEAPSEADEQDEEAVEGDPVDWAAFAESPECQALDENLRPLATQIGPMLEQLVTQVAQLPLTAITGQELAGLLIQVLPQAAPPQVVNAALSPQGLNALQALTAFLARTGAALHGDDLVEGIKLVRQTMREQIRSSGMLGGPDYSDPDETGPDDATK